MRLATTAEASALTGISKSTLALEAKRGRFPHIKIGRQGTRRKIMFEMDLLEECLKKEALDSMKPQAEEAVWGGGGLREIKKGLQ
jgi:hypothetical protein